MSIYENHKKVVEALQDRVIQACKQPVAVVSANQSVKDTVMAYSIAVDKLGTFNQRSTTADGTATVALKDSL